MDETRESLMPAAVVGRSLPAPVTLTTIHRWIKVGLPPRNGGPNVKLRAHKRGTRLFTCLRWVAEFQAKLDAVEPDATAAAPPPPVNEKPKTPTRRPRAAHRAADAELRKAGI